MEPGRGVPGTERHLSLDNRKLLRMEGRGAVLESFLFSLSLASFHIPSSVSKFTVSVALTEKPITHIHSFL